MPSNELFYLDKDGKKRDAELHAELLEGEHYDAVAVSAELLRELGFSEEEIEDYFPGHGAVDHEDELPLDDAQIVKVPGQIGNPYHDPATGKFTHGPYGEGIVKLTQVMQRVYEGKPVEHSKLYSANDSGRITTSIAATYAQKVLKLSGTEILSQLKGFKAYDMAAGNLAIEIKGGMVSNKEAKWKSGTGGRSPQQKEWRRQVRANGTARQKAMLAKEDAEREAAISKRKYDQLKRMSKERGVTYKPRTIGLIVNPDTKTADIYVIEGFPKIIRWKQVSKFYRGTYRYEY